MRTWMDTACFMREARMHCRQRHEQTGRTRRSAWRLATPDQSFTPTSVKRNPAGRLGEDEDVFAAEDEVTVIVFTIAIVDGLAALDARPVLRREVGLINLSRNWVALRIEVSFMYGSRV